MRIEGNNKLQENEARMPPQELKRWWKVNRVIVTHVERKSPLHGKRVFNNNLVVIRLIATYVILKGNSDNEQLQIGGQ